VYDYIAFVGLPTTVISKASDGKYSTSWIQTRMVLSDVKSSGSARYLGYPLYHTNSQLKNYLDGVLVKVQRHSNILNQRNLSIRGAGLVANSLLLSKVYHLLHVVLGGRTTVSWVRGLKKVVREYVVSFRPSVAWSALCLPRKFGGVGLVDISDQSLALHLIYLQRFLRP
jgi:hypothetical protein